MPTVGSLASVALSASPDTDESLAVPAGPLTAAAPETLTAEELLRWRRDLLRWGGRAVDLDWLLDLAGGLRWSALQALRLDPRRPVHLLQDRQGLEALWRRHLEGAEPLQYLVGRCPWRDLELVVAPGVLIPRQDTEHLVELALELAPPSLNDTSGALWADLGTGSGCLAVALAQALPCSKGLAVEISEAARSIAAANLAAADLTQRVRVLPGSWWEALRPWWGQLDLVVSNPPYIPSAVIPTLAPVVRDHEPILALDGGSDGLTAIRAIVAEAAGALAPGGLLVLEHHHDQSAAVMDLLAAAGLVAPTPHRDLQGHSRFASARSPGALGVSWAA
jgi:release factor glutamine methyltransferase